MAPVGHTRTHSPHHVQPALSGSPSAPTTISACSPRHATSRTPTTWMSAHARTHRVHRMQVDMSWRIDRKSTRLNSSHGYISYAVFCLEKKKKSRKTRSRDN